VNHLPATAWWRPAGIAAATASPASCTCWRASGSQLSGSWGHIKAGQRAQAVVAVDVNLLGDERAAGSQDPADLGRPERLVPASDQPNTPSPKGSRPRSFPVCPVLPGAPSSWTTGMLSGRSRDRRSPPPVPMSSRAPAAAARWATSRWELHGSGPADDRAASHEKSSPKTGHPAPRERARQTWPPATPRFPE